MNYAWSQWNDLTSKDKPYLETPTDEEVESAIKNGSYKCDKYTLWYHDNPRYLAVVKVIPNGIGGNRYQDVYRF